jgi:hypothetical protein
MKLGDGLEWFIRVPLLRFFKSAAFKARGILGIKKECGFTAVGLGSYR